MSTKNRVLPGGCPAIGTAILLAVFTIQGATSADRYQGEKWNLLDPAKVMTEAEKITNDNYPDCDYATVEQKSVRVYRSDGTGEAQDETFLKVLTEKGKRNNRTLRLQFMLPYTTVEVVKLEIIGE